MGDETSTSQAVEVNASARGSLNRLLFLLLGLFGFILNLQGNIIPFLKVELNISYRIVGLHPTAYACGVILVGVFGPVFIRRFGRQCMLTFGVLGFTASSMLLCLATAAPVSLASFALLGLSGAFIPTVVFSTLAGAHVGKRAVVVFNQATATASVFGIAAPMLTALFIFLGLGWRSAVMVGISYGLAVLVAFRRVRLPSVVTTSYVADSVLPACYWAYWIALAFGIATEFCILLWAPTFLEGVIGLSETVAAIGAAAFAVAMTVGRLAASRVAGAVPVVPLFVSSVFVALAGFLLYWGSRDVAASLTGLFVLGFGISLFYPLILGQAIGATPVPLHDTASARTAIAAGVALLTMPGLLGELASRNGMHNAHLLVPALLVALLTAFMIGRRLGSPPHQARPR